MKSNHVYTQHNLKGKKHKTLSCGCCDMQDFREDYDAEVDRKLIRDFRANPNKDFLTKGENQARIDELFDRICLRYATVLKYIQNDK